MKSRYTALIDDNQRQVLVQSMNEHFYQVQIDEEQVALEVSSIGDGQYLVRHGTEVFDMLVTADARGRHVARGTRQTTINILDETALARSRLGNAAAGGLGAQGQISAPMPGRIVKVLVEQGDQVSVGQGLIIVEAMKMENELRAEIAGTVTRIAVNEGTPVEAGDILVTIDASVPEG